MTTEVIWVIGALIAAAFVAIWLRRSWTDPGPRFILIVVLMLLLAFAAVFGGLTVCSLLSSNCGIH